MITDLRSPHGRQAHTGPPRDQTSEPASHADETTRLVRGLTLGVLLSLPVWGVIGWIIWSLI